MGAWGIPIPDDLEPAVLAGTLTLAEAWELMDERLLAPFDPYPEEMGLLLAKMEFATLQQESRPLH